MSVLREKTGVEIRPDAILVTDGETRAALAITRSLGRDGYAIHVASQSGRSLAGASRFCTHEHRVPNAESEPTAWAERVESLARTFEARLLPTTELAIGSLFAAHSESRVDVIAPSPEDYAAAIDKFGLVERAKRLDIDVPESVLVERSSDLERLPETLRFPVVAKPRRSRILHEGSWHSPPVLVLRDAAALEMAISDWQPAHGETLFQEFVPGRGEGLFAVSRQGRIQARFAHRRLREKPPLGGVSVLRESIEVADDVADASERLLADLGFSGIAMVEFRRAPDGRLVLMEINPRPWGSMQLAIDAGIDFPSLMLEAHRNEVPKTATARVARIGVRTRWLLGDLDHWLICARSPALRRELGISILGLSLGFLKSFVDGTRLEILKLHDPRPFGRELIAWITSFGSR